MKKSRIILTSIALATALESTAVYASTPIGIRINGSIVPAPAYTHTINNQVMLPIRWVAEQLGARSIGWDPAANTVLIQTDDRYYKYVKLLSYAQGLAFHGTNKEAQVSPLSENAKLIKFSPLPTRQFNLTDGATENTPFVDISINNFKYRDYDIEVHDDHIYVSSDWIEQLFKAIVDYDTNSNQLSIQFPSEQEIDDQIAKVEEALLTATPQEALNLWTRGEQTRSGALQYAALSPELRNQALEHIAKNGCSWVTGVSSPWVGPITIKDQTKLSDTVIEYTVTYPEITSAGTYTGAEKMDIEYLSINGKQGWYITKILLASPYSILPDMIQVTTPVDYQTVDNTNVADTVHSMIEENKQASGVFQLNADNSRYVMISSGEKPTTGYSITLVQVTSSENAIYVHTHTSDPQPNTIQAMHITYPYVLIKIQDLQKPIYWENEKPN